VQLEGVEPLQPGHLDRHVHLEALALMWGMFRDQPRHPLFAL
jgi:hypothetical protein